MPTADTVVRRPVPVDESATPLDQVLFLARAESRVEILRSLADSTATQRELRTRLDVSRTTVSRALQSLSEREWVEKSGDEYRLTQAGRHVLTAFDQLLETVAQVDELTEFLRWFPADIDPPDVLGANDIDVTYSTTADPYAPARTQAEILHTATQLRVLLPAIELESTKTLADQVTDRGLDVESVLSPGLEATIESDDFAPPMRRTVQAGAKMFIAQTSLPFYLGLADDNRVQIGLADDEGIPRALLETTDDDVRTWGEDVYREYRASARYKPLEEF
jgi:predicted transcriptional regulator